jgi:hypothetical protein
MTARPWLVIVLALALGGCASGVPLDAVLRQAPPVAGLRFGVDTFAFPNESRTKNHDKPDLYANYCFVMARGVTQFLRFARFAPEGARLAGPDYALRVRQVVARPPWADPLPWAERVVFPGYASLYELSRDEEAAVKEGLGGQVWSLLHWTNWRVIFPAPGWHQERVARQTLLELAEGRPVQLLVTNFPTIELNHSVLAYQYRVGEGGDVDLVVYDPNDPYAPGVVTFDRAERRFVATRLFDTDPGLIRAFRMYYGPLL